MRRLGPTLDGRSESGKPVSCASSVRFRRIWSFTRVEGRRSAKWLVARAVRHRTSMILWTRSGVSMVSFLDMSKADQRASLLSVLLGWNSATASYRQLRARYDAPQGKVLCSVAEFGARENRSKCAWFVEKGRGWHLTFPGFLAIRSILPSLGSIWAEGSIIFEAVGRRWDARLACTSLQTPLRHQQAIPLYLHKKV